jgi:peptidoglycan/LPS O-acetylase OafA/YrhL
LITRLLLAENKSSGSISLRDFYIRRFLRLYPVLVFYVALVLVVSFARSQAVNPLDVASVFLYFVNYRVLHYDALGHDMPFPAGVLWSLSVEEHFYLLAPLALVLVRGSAKKMLLAAGFVCILSLALRLIYAHIYPGIVDTLELYRRSETRFDCIAYGVIFACLTEFAAGLKIMDWLTTRTAFFLGLCVLLASFAVRDNYFQNTWRFSIQGLALFPLVAGVVYARPFPLANRLLNTSLLVWVGALSYSLYVWHGGTIFLFGSLLIDRLPHVAQPLAEVAISVLLAVFSYYIIERPVLRLRRRFSHSAGKRTAAAPSLADAPAPASTA